MHLKDPGEYIQPIDKQVDLFLEAGGIIRRSYDLRAPVPLFENVRL